MAVIKRTLVSFVLVVLIALFSRHVLKLIRVLGIFTFKHDHEPGPCRFVEGTETGSEDFHLLPDGFTFISTGLTWPYVPYNSSVRKGIYGFDFKNLSGGLVWLPLQGEFNQENIMGYHGVSAWRDHSSGKYSINVQLVCDSRYRIINVVARWPGSVHDSRILQESRLGHAFENGDLQGLLLGDSGYAQKTWLMTPIGNPRTAAETAYNSAHKSTRAMIEHLNGQLKNKFLCLSGNGPLVKTPERACDVIVACCCLFNISKDDYIQEPYDHVLPPDPDDVHAPVPDDAHGVAARNELINNFFT